MGALRKVQPNYGTLPKHHRDSKNTLPLSATVNQESTLATVMMTRLYDTAVQTKFNRLLLMAQNDKVTSTYPLNRNITNIGRSRRNHIRIKDPLVSVKHLTVSVSGNTCVVNDLESSNGTFINGERVVGSHVLKDGEEMMLGKTILKFAARQNTAPVKEAKAPKGPEMPLNKKRLALLAAALLFFMMSVAFVYLGTHIATQLYTDKTPSIAKKTADSSPRISAQGKKSAQSPVQVHNKADVTRHEEPAMQTSLIKSALTDYATGRIDRAVQTLKMVSTAKEGTPAALQAKRILSMVGTVKDLYASAQRAQEDKIFAKALDSWDRLLIMDMELLGDRPSYFTAQAEQTVQELSYEHALEAYRLKNHKKVKQLCNVILQINPKNSEALALLAKVNPKA